MLNKDSISQSIALAALVASKGMTVSAVDNTPLMQLVKITTDLNSSQCFPNDQTLETVSAQMLSLATATLGGEQPSGHDLEMDGYITDIAKAVQKHLSFSKNVVKPVIMNVVTAVEQMMSQPTLASSEFKIIIDDLPKPMFNAGFEASINKYEGKPYIKPESEFRLEQLAPQEILELMHSGSKEFDSLVDEWFALRDDLFFTDLWGNLFMDFKVSKPSIVYNMTDVFVGHHDADDHALAVYLLSRKLYEQVNGTSGLNLTQYKDLMAQYRDASGATLYQIFSKYQSIVKNKMLVKSYNVNGKEITVHGIIYRGWIKDNSNEVLLGILASEDNTRLFSLDNIDSKKDKLLQQWNSYSSFYNTASKNKAFNKYIQSLEIAFFDELAHKFEEESEILLTTGDYEGKVRKLFKEELAKITNHDLTDVFYTCTKLVCRSRFFYTDAEKILLGINEAVKANPNVDIKEAALMSTIEYVCDYVADQMRVG